MYLHPTLYLSVFPTPITHITFTLLCRCQSSARHYRIVWDGKQFSFGLGKFPTVDELKAHFDNRPIISGDSGVVSLTWSI